MTRKSSRWFVYILRCADGSFYTGITTDIPRRCRQHNLGSASRYTRSRRPVHLAHLEMSTDRPAALRREAAIKKLSRTQKLALIHAARACA